MDSPCIYCGKPCYDRNEEMEHWADCPSVTNLWPTLIRDLVDGMGCCRCDYQFALGESHTTVPYTDDEGHTDDGTVEIVCLDCAFIEAVSTR